MQLSFILVATVSVFAVAAPTGSKYQLLRIFGCSRLISSDDEAVAYPDSYKRALADDAVAYPDSYKRDAADDAVAYPDSYKRDAADEAVAYPDSYKRDALE